MAENDMEALAAKLKKTESDLVRIGWLDDADNVREAFTALRSTTAEPGEVVERIQDMIETAYIAGATAVHEAWVDGNGQSEADFAEAASDYGVSVSEQIPHPTDSAAKDAEKYRLMLLDLLAVIHRDGGHRTQELGIKLSCEQAMRLSSERIAALANRGEAGSLAKEREE